MLFKSFSQKQFFKINHQTEIRFNQKKEIVAILGICFIMCNEV